jgi:hypothetical protein
LIVAVVLGLILIAYFSWSEQKSGIFQWWHVCVMLVALIFAILAKILPWMGNVIKNVKRYIGFDKESEGVSNGVKREYFMALVPMYFIASLYLMQAALRGGKVDIMTMFLSILVLMFSLYLVIVSFLRKLSDAWVRNTYQVASSLAIVGVVVFCIELLKATMELIDSGINYWYVVPIIWVGLFVVFGIMVFHMISMYGRD